MSDELQAMAERLRELSSKLRDPGLSEEDAEGLAREAADLAAQGGAAIDQRLRELAQSGPPDPDG